jgi:hypothetical protein
MIYRMVQRTSTKLKKMNVSDLNQILRDNKVKGRSKLKTKPEKIAKILELDIDISPYQSSRVKRVITEERREQLKEQLKKGRRKLCKKEGNRDDPLHEAREKMCKGEVKRFKLEKKEKRRDLPKIDGTPVVLPTIPLPSLPTVSLPSTRPPIPIVGLPPLPLFPGENTDFVVIDRPPIPIVGLPPLPLLPGQDDDFVIVNPPEEKKDDDDDINNGKFVKRQNLQAIKIYRDSLVKDMVEIFGVILPRLVSSFADTALFEPERILIEDELDRLVVGAERLPEDSLAIVRWNRTELSRSNTFIIRIMNVAGMLDPRKIDKFEKKGRSLEQNQPGDLLWDSLEDFKNVKIAGGGELIEHEIDEPSDFGGELIDEIPKEIVIVDGEEIDISDVKTPTPEEEKELLDIDADPVDTIGLDIEEPGDDDPDDPDDPGGVDVGVGPDGVDIGVGPEPPTAEQTQALLDKIALAKAQLDRGSKRGDETIDDLFESILDKFVRKERRKLDLNDINVAEEFLYFAKIDIRQS